MAFDDVKIEWFEARFVDDADPDDGDREPIPGESDEYVATRDGPRWQGGPQPVPDSERAKPMAAQAAAMHPELAEVVNLSREYDEWSSFDAGPALASEGET